MLIFSGLESLTADKIANLVMDMESKGERVMIPAQQATESRTENGMSEGKLVGTISQL